MTHEEANDFTKKENKKFSHIISEEFTAEQEEDMVDRTLFELEVEQAAVYLRAFAKEVHKRTDDVYVVAAALAMVSHEWDHKTGDCDEA